MELTVNEQFKELKMFTRNDVAKMLNVSKETVSMLIAVGALKAIKIGKCYMFSKSSIVQFQNDFMGYDLSNKRKAIKVLEDFKTRKELN